MQRSSSHKNKIVQEDEDVLSYQPRPNQLLMAKKQKEITLTKDDKYVAPKISSNLSKD